MNPHQPPSGSTPSFHGLGIAPSLLTALSKCGFTAPTPIQLQAIPPAVEGKDVVGIAQTGTGKTFAFGIPLLQRLASVRGQGLILLPTRELALQVETELHKIGTSFRLRTALLIGGLSMSNQVRALREKPHIIIATPGRLNDHLEQRTCSLNDVRVLVLDEADRMLDMGFWPQVKRIISVVPRERQVMLFSATLSREIMDLAAGQMKLPVRIEVAPAGTTAEKVSQEFFVVRKEDKVRLLQKVLAERRGSTIVFTRTKHGATRVMRSVKAMGHPAAEIHSNRSLGQRRDALEGFKAGRYRVLVATDIAARGIDVKGVELVINYDMPSQAEDYVHRIGRTARAGADGHAITFAMPDERRDIRDIERLIRKAVPVSPTPELPPAIAPVPEPFGGYGERRPFRGHSHVHGGRGTHGGHGRPPRRGYGQSRSHGPHRGR